VARGGRGSIHCRHKRRVNIVDDFATIDSTSTPLTTAAQE
jgi:hypothetical protein